jgi:hypothetical protein
MRITDLPFIVEITFTVIVQYPSKMVQASWRLAASVELPLIKSVRFSLAYLIRWRFVFVI